MKLRLIIEVIILAERTRLKRRFIVIAFHYIIKDFIYILDGIGVASEIHIKVNCCCKIICVLGIFLICSFENRRLGLSESVDRLLHIANLEDVVLPRHLRDEVLLDIVRILIFINEYIFEALAHYVRNFWLGQNLSGCMLHVAEVKKAFFLLKLLISLLEGFK